jgi:hypothetical protein
MSGHENDAEGRGFTMEDLPESQTEGEGIPKMDFSTFAISLGTSALYHMGVVKGPDGDEVGEKNLPFARQTIDTLEMIAEKTRGNLDRQEAKLLESLLFELRMRFVESEK